MTFKTFFQTLTSHPAPRAWQTNLAADSTPRSRLIRRVTGDGKTEGVLTAWLWNALAHPEKSVRSNWPRRLVWCLPMRVLVEQTVATAWKLIEKLPEDQRPGIAVLMGGEDMEPWFLHPSKQHILIGTQDMLLSRALNRGYASGRARWPVEFGLLNQDSLWVMDEVQLMDVGLATSAQLQAYRDQDANRVAESANALKPSYTWWMSATLQPNWLKTVDTEPRHDNWIVNTSVATAAERNGGLWEVSKTVVVDEIAVKDTKPFAERILQEHAESEPTEYGRITLVVCNTVDRAIETFKAVSKQGSVEDVRLVHSRFRQTERESWRSDFLNRSACMQHVDRIIIATQVVEAGVDISATCLITELAPWPSLVQRFGRCARYGGVGKVIIVRRFVERKSKDETIRETAAAPYDAETLENTLASVKLLSDVGIRSLEEFEEQLDEDGRAKLYAYEPQHLLMRGEYDELFDTTPDLTGTDLDISRFIRTGKERDLQVFWADLGKDETPDNNRKPLQLELCSVQFLKARDWLCGKNKTDNLLKGMHAWVWDFLDGKWKDARRKDLLPGRIVCVAASCGGYDETLGFDSESTNAVNVVEVPRSELTQSSNSDAAHDDESSNYSKWQSIAFHTEQVVEKVGALCKKLSLSPELTKLLILAARWHDLGKAHPAFQGATKNASEEDTRPERNDLAKGPPEAWRSGKKMYQFAIDENKIEIRPSLRHELASALAMFSILRMYMPNHPALLGPWQEAFEKMGRKVPHFEEPVSPPTVEIQEVLELSAEEFDLLVYLIASHHGKVRVALHASPADQEFVAEPGDVRGLPIRGIRKDDVLPSVAITPKAEPQPEFALTLEPAAMGLSFETGKSWRERCEDLIQRLGPTTLAALEAILRAADVEASCSQVEDPEFAKVTN
ncbi:MAG: CRISPR-associated helicase Cas3' [Planctomycetales bacterium]|nr:CRISPR-associated helicase Cas3' [Planctomycetales bacterium]